MITQRINRPCILHQRQVSTTERDDMGDPVVTENDRHTVCELQRQSTTELRDGRTVLVSRWLLILPAGTTITGWDDLTIDGIRYTLDGAPWNVRHPRTGAIHHVEANVRQVS